MKTRFVVVASVAAVAAVDVVAAGAAAHGGAFVVADHFGARC